MSSFEDNIYILSKTLSEEYELYQTILTKENIQIERIISTGQKTPDNQWLEQDRNEWVILLQGESEMSFENGESKFMRSGDYIYIPKNQRHRVKRTSKEPPCVWLAIHFD